MMWQARHEPPRVRSATSFWPLAASPVTGPSSFFGAVGAGGDAFGLASGFNADVSRGGQPAWRFHGDGAASPGASSGGRLACAGCCAATGVGRIGSASETSVPSATVKPDLIRLLPTQSFARLSALLHTPDAARNASRHRDV